ncbi:MAG: histidinol dehydrogenase [Acholeplasmatales bacterium]|nr:histidinol dehydrogenase [Acholeplasmatales bacterium]
MIEIISDKNKIKEYFEILKKRSAVNSGDYFNTVQEIVNKVRDLGDEGVEFYTKKFDDSNFDIKNAEVSKEEQQKAFNSLDENIKRVLLRSKERILSYHEHQKRTTWEYKDEIGASLGQKITPLKKVGVYVPGGKAFYPSSALMNILPAKVAGVKEVIMVTPAVKGHLEPLVLAAAYVCEVDHVFKIGGAQAIAALAYGTKTIPQVDKIVGPGNIFVALAKREVYGLVGIDSIAGPSEIAIIADSTAHPKFLAADLLAQAEHDPMASSTLLITDENVAKKTLEYVKEFYKTSPRQNILDSSLTNTSRIIICKDLDEAIEYSNKIAPEHLELALDNARSIIDKIDNAGAIFIGHYSAEVYGDYMAGPNHVLPTCGTARFFSPLGVDDFIKKTSLIEFSKDSALKLLDDVDVFAKCENLTMHALSASVRKDD